MDRDALEKFARSIYEFENIWHYNLSTEYSKESAPKGLLNRNRNRALFMIEQNERLIATDIAKFLEMKKGSVTSLVNDLEKKGFVYKEADEIDKRKVWICITKDGRRFTEIMNKAYGEVLLNIFGDIDSGELLKGAECMDIVIKIMEKARK
ncbi:MarR family winged helix-turn-helix transcriptional regulator [Clostridium grantii]|uniref:Transcriptional regulator, MarR family n=1 Tax=Clostridium grantii DSM 8605 TaxID=1121316 RepID=A0A1M5UQJ3_9CLOT|nr:MarR family transcriptional regulator [Clostridium grantii]SHH64933.1 transcriptional regulator, MarR family [Clostridium grantii DSM 8605]